MSEARLDPARVWRILRRPDSPSPRAVRQAYLTPCFWDGLPIPVGLKTVDHLVPRYMGGGDLDENLKPCCQKCNLERGRISAAVCGHAQLRRHLAGVRHPDKRERMRRKWLAEGERCLPLVAKYRALILERVEDPLARRRMLGELDALEGLVANVRRALDAQGKAG